MQKFKTDYIGNCREMMHILTLSIKYVSICNEFAFNADINVRQESFYMSNNIPSSKE